MSASREVERTMAVAGASLDVWSGHEVDGLRSEWGVPRLVALTATGSTNDVARRLAEAGAAHGTTVVADHQTAGRGRHGRAWSDRAGASLLLSMVLRPGGAHADSSTAGPAVLPLLAGLACVRAIRALVDADVRIEWPNDLVVDDLKLGGILCEAALRRGAIDFVVAGIGINVDALPDELDPALRPIATSLHALGAAVDRAALAGEIARRILRLRADSPLDARALAGLRRLDALAGRRVRLGSGREGVAVGILADGALEVDEDGGARLNVLGGSVSPVAPRAD